MNPIEFYSKLEKFPLSEFGSYFTNFRNTAFRLEQLPVFNVPQEVDSLALFNSGQAEPPADFNNEWHDILANARSCGKKFSRSRVIDGSLTNYLRFEILWAYKRNREEGEDIRFILRDEPKLFKTTVPILKDFWLFDESECFLMEYDYCGTFLGVTKVPANATSLYVSLMEETKASSVSFDDAVRKLGI